MKEYILSEGYPNCIRVGLLLLVLLGSNMVSAQITLHILDKAERQGVEGAVVAAMGSRPDEAFSGVTDKSGKIRISSLSFPITVQVRHVSFEPLTQEIIKPGESTLYLQATTLALEQVVITGQHEPQSVNQAVHTVQAIGKKRIEDQAAIDLADVLSNNLNITISHGKENGRSTISMLGLEAQYVKILIDGIPFAGVEGNGNNADISQINMNSIERIEIVEGPMAVSYGANALAGVINLITKKTADVSISIQEESVGREYGWSQGRHIQSFNVGHRFSEQLLIRADFLRNDFRGFKGPFKGKNHLLDDDRRGFDWHPKNQYSGGGSIDYTGKAFQASYRYGYFYQKLDRFSSQVFPDEHPASGISNPFALDEDIATKRFLHQLNFSGSIFGKVNFSIINGYTGVEMTSRTFRRRLVPDNIEEITNEFNSRLNSVTSRGNFTHSSLIKSDDLSLEAGYEYTGESIDDRQIQGGSQRIDNMAMFGSVEFSPGEKLTFRPGLRTMYNSSYETPLIYSMNVMYKGPADVEVRGTFGRSYRTPDLTELYLYFVDANHDVRGNPDLTPEDGIGTSLDLKRRAQVGKGYLTTVVKLFFNSITDQITLGVVDVAQNRFQYINIDRFKSQGFTFTNNFTLAGLIVNTGISYIGRYNRLNEQNDGLATFLYAPEVNLNVRREIKKLNLSAAIFYKHTGKIEQFVLDPDTEEFRKGKTQSFNWLDFSTTWNLNKSIRITGGIRNIFNISDINTTSGTAGAHSAAPSSVGLAYGRSYFLRFAYHFR